MNNAQRALHLLPQAVSNMIDQLKGYHIDLSTLMLDHACWRCNSTQEYEEMCHELYEFADILAKDTIISNRRITTFKLLTPIVIDDIYTIDVIEIPDIKVSSTYNSGWEHIEFTAQNLAEFVKKHQNLPFKLKGLKSKHHPCVTLPLKQNQNVKFNMCSLQNQITKEQEN
tara:strand:- start:143741 stop:144250 length:510 start_codon:yes stop_codon:yes gene_type:complete